MYDMTTIARKLDAANKTPMTLTERLLIDEIRRLRAQVDSWIATGNAIMLCATGKEAPLSDSDVCGEIDRLRAQQAILIQAMWHIREHSLYYHDREIATKVLTDIGELR